MRIFFDTSVLVAALSARHREHAKALPWLNRALDEDVEGWLSSHALAALYNVMTGHPSWRIPPEALLRALREDFVGLNIIALDVEDYWAVLDRLVQLNLPGGGIYDALHAQAALKAQAEVLLTLNPRHFTRLGEDVAVLVRVP